MRSGAALLFAAANRPIPKGNRYRVAYRQARRGISSPAGAGRSARRGRVPRTGPSRQGQAYPPESRPGYPRAGCGALESGALSWASPCWMGSGRITACTSAKPARGSLTAAQQGGQISLPYVAADDRKGRRLIHKKNLLQGSLCQRGRRCCPCAGQEKRPVPWDEAAALIPALCRRQRKRRSSTPGPVCEPMTVPM